MLESIAAGASLLFLPRNILFCCLGSFAGVILGAIPGVTATMSIALLVPITFTLAPEAGLIMLGGIYCGAIYGGSISAILLRTPGTPSAAATIFDGYAMTQKGEAGKALGLAIYASLVGGLLSASICLFASPQVANVALKFQSPEMFWLVICGLTIMVSVAGRSLIKGLIAGLLGLVLATIGMHPFSGFIRFSFGWLALYEGLPFIVALIGLFGFSQTMVLVEKGGEEKQVATAKIERIFPGWKLLNRLKWLAIRSGLIGLFIGAIPGPGGTASIFFAYDQAKKTSKTPEKFGTGIPEGIVAPEAANNGVTGGALIPMLALGIPGNAATAALIGGLIIHGLVPGPKLFIEHSAITYAFLLSLFIANLSYAAVGFMAVRYLAKIAFIPRGFLAPAITVFCVIGTYAIRNSLVDVGIMLGMGLLGYALRKLDFPLAPIVIAMILGPLAEENLIRSMALAGIQGISVWQFFATRPICVMFLILAALSLGFAFKQRMTGKKITD